MVSGRWILERYILNEKNLRHSVGELQDINCSNINDKCAIQLSPNEGFLFEDNYGYSLPMNKELKTDKKYLSV